MTELKKKTEKELATLLAEKYSALQKFAFTISGGKARNVKEGREIKKDIARILTEMRWRKQS